MCIIDIVEFIQDYIDCKTLLNSGEYYYNNMNDIDNFSILLINNFNSQFKENFILEFSEKTKVVAQIYNKTYICELKNDFNNNYSWVVVI